MKKLLVLDDDIDLLDVLQMAFSDAGYHTKCVSKVDDIVGLVRSFSPDVLLVDLMLNGVDGGHLCAYLKGQPETKHLPIIIFTAGQNPSWRAGSFGCDEFIYKPFDLFELISKISLHSDRLVSSSCVEL